MPHAAKSAGIILAAVLSAAGVVEFAGFHSNNVLRTEWQRSIVSASEDELPAILGQWRQQPEVSVPLLVELLGSERRGVAAAAEKALGQELDHWRSLSPEQAAARISILSGALASSIEHFPREGQQAAEALARRIVRWPLDGRGPGTHNVSADCEAVFRAVGRARPSENEAVPAIEMPRDDDRDNGQNREPPPTVAGKTEIFAVPALSGGGLPLEPAELPPPAVAADAPQLRIVHPPDPPQEIYAPLAIPLYLSDGANVGEESDSSAEDGVRRPGSSEPSARMQSGGDVLRSLSEIDLAELLHADPPTAEVARRELRRRGFAPQELQLARAVRHSDPREREELARALPQIPGIDARYWLKHLAADEAEQVRRAAISVLGSSRDAATAAWLRQRREHEPDQRTRRLIDELLESRR